MPGLPWPRSCPLLITSAVERPPRWRIGLCSGGGAGRPRAARRRDLRRRDLRRRRVQPRHARGRAVPGARHRPRPGRGGARRRAGGRVPRLRHDPRAVRRDARAALELGVEQVDGVVFDLGVSSFQLDEGARGFSFQADGPLDMRMAKAGRPRPTWSTGSTSASSRGFCPATATSRRPAPSPGRSRPPGAGADRHDRALAAIVARAKGGRHGPRDPATRTFQALRIAVNDELGELERASPPRKRCSGPAGGSWSCPSIRARTRWSSAS